ncbi:hypothetical protein HW511_06870 [Asaia siamensis]|uniref:hypothetical protein n=1 Tax=Asaia siamensis TaxID=110479 RepID=UPI00166F3452|nr:hypothetical protein [Asaia siamensis]
MVLGAAEVTRMFDIRFGRRAISYDEDGYFGSLYIEEKREGFFSNLSFFSKEKYEESWRNSAKRLLETGKSYFLTNVYRPRNANFINSWPCQILENRVFIQEKLLFRWQHSMKRAINFDLVLDDMDFVNEDGERISTWSTSINSVEQFLARQA